MWVQNGRTQFSHETSIRKSSLFSRNAFSKELLTVIFLNIPREILDLPKFVFFRICRQTCL